VPVPLDVTNTEALVAAIRTAELRRAERLISSRERGGVRRSAHEARMGEGRAS